MSKYSVTTELKNLLESNRAVHAYIVEGQKHDISFVLKDCAKTVMCSQLGCDSCEVCGKINQGIHTDCIMLPSTKSSKRIVVEDINLLVEESLKRPVDNGSVRVFTLDATESTNVSGSESWQNKLLKTLEEPLSGIYIFIGVTSRDQLFPTIVSRCQILTEKSAGYRDTVNKLMQNGYKRSVSEIASVLSFGNYQTAQVIMADDKYNQIVAFCLTMLRELKKPKDAINYAMQMSKDKNNIDIYLLTLTVLFNESVLQRTNKDLCKLTTYSSEIEAISREYTIEACTEIVILLNKVAKTTKGNLAVVVDNLLVDILEVKHRCRI